MKIISFFILSAFVIDICLTVSVSKASGYYSSEKKCCPFSQKKKAIVYYSVDNVANYYSINGVATYLSTVPFYNDWTYTKKANIMLAPGDVFCLNGNNLPGGNESTNPAAIIASIRYYNYNGSLAWLNTDSSWSCDGIKAKLFKKNGDTSSIWQSVKGGPLTDIQANAWWIWDTKPWSPTSSTTCCVTIPCCVKTSKYSYYDDDD